MSKRRMIDPAFWQSETMASLTVDQRFLFIGLFSNADDQGRLKGHPALIRNAIFPFDDPDLNKLQSDLDVIEATGSITQYKADGKSFVQINGWWEYQSPQWAYPSEIPAPDGWQDRLNYRWKNGFIVRQNWDIQKHKSRSYPSNWDEVREFIFNRDDHICVYCGATATEIDHIIPVSNGGCHEKNNLVASCVTCNRTKSDKDFYDWFVDRFGHINEVIECISAIHNGESDE